MEFATYQPTSKIKRMFLQNEETNHTQNVKKSKNINKGVNMIYQNDIKNQEANMKFYLNISEDTLYDHRIPYGARILYGKIQSLSHKEGFCWACNKYLAKVSGVSIRTVQRWIESLKENGYIKSEIIYKEGTKEVVCRKLLLNSMTSEHATVGMGGHDTNSIELINNKTNKYDIIEIKKTYARARMCAHTCDKNENEKNIETEKDLKVNNEVESSNKVENSNNVENSNKVESSNKVEDSNNVENSNQFESSNNVENLESEENQEVINKPKYEKSLQLNKENTKKYSEESENIPNSSLNHSENKAHRKTYNQIIEEYTPNKELQDKLKQFLPVKFMKCKRLTNDALRLLLSDLDKYASTIKEKLAIVAKSIKRCYSEFFPLSESEKDLYLSEPKKTSYNLEEYAKLCFSVFDD